jgi:tRNA nucleotidyltransferase (CCA-adding enzyme)
MIMCRPTFDIDIVIEGDGIRCAEAFAVKLGASISRHHRFGTASVTLTDGRKLDFATARKERYPQPAHLPVVQPGTLQDDLLRRDFTINTMAIRLESGGLGPIIDHRGGRQDLLRKKIRVLHDASFIDDPTRILRAIRFEQRFGFRIESHTLRLLKDALRDGWLSRVHAHRLRNELILLLKEKTPLRVIKRMRKLTGFGFIAPALTVNSQTFSLFRSVDRQCRWYKKNMPTAGKLSAWLVYSMALMEALGTRQVRSLCKKFAFSKVDEQRIIEYMREGRRLALALKKKGLAPSQLYALLAPLSIEAIIMLKAHYPAPVIQRHIADYVGIHIGTRITVTGQDLQRLGLAPGPRYQKILRAVLRARLDGKVHSRKEELAYIKQIARSP